MSAGPPVSTPVGFRTPPIGYLGTGAALFVLLQATPATSSLALPVLVLAALIGTWKDDFDFARSPTAIEWAAAALALVWLISAALGLDPLRSLRLSMPTLAFLILLVGLGRDRHGEAAASALLWSLAAVATLWSLQCVWHYAHGVQVPEQLVAQMDVAWIVVPNDVAYAAVLWPVWCRDWRTRTNPQRALIVLALAVQCLAFVALGSRLALLLAALGLITAMSSLPGRRAWIGIISVALAGALLMLAWPGLAEKGTRSLLARGELWQAALAVFADAPLTGVGPHNYVLRYGDAMTTADLRLDSRLTPWPHSLPLEILTETGVLGCAAAALLIGCAAFRPPARRASALLQLAAAIPALILCMLEASTLRVWLWMLAAWWLGRANRQPLIRACTPSPPDAPPD